MPIVSGRHSAAARSGHRLTSAAGVLSEQGSGTLAP
jgi:hypothetical protein